MSSTYFVRFGSGDPRQFAGLSPTFVVFRESTGGTPTPPAIIAAGPSTGIYTFTYGATVPTTFIIDGATTGLGTQGRFVTGDLDPRDLIDQTGSTLFALGTTSVALGITNVALGTTILGQVNAYGATNVALGTSNLAIGTTILAEIQSASLGILAPAIGSTASSFGTDVADPNSLFGYLKRLQELIEGNAAYGRVSNAWSMYSRGSSTLLRTKNIASDAVGVTKA